MKFKVNKHYKIVLNNGHIYRGRILSQKDKILELFDFKYKDVVMISIIAIIEVIPISPDGDLLEFNK